jgi:hypothetical protein
MLSSLIVVGAVWGGYQLFSEHQADTIYVVAAQNCPHAAAQQADQLARSLGKQGIPVVRVNQVSYPTQQIDRTTMNRLMVLMNGPLPLVFVHGRAAMKPELTQVVEEYYRPGSLRRRSSGHSESSWTRHPGSAVGNTSSPPCATSYVQR